MRKSTIVGYQWEFLTVGWSIFLLGKILAFIRVNFAIRIIWMWRFNQSDGLLPAGQSTSGLSMKRHRRLNSGFNFFQILNLHVTFHLFFEFNKFISYLGINKKRLSQVHTTRDTADHLEVLFEFQLNNKDKFLPCTNRGRHQNHVASVSKLILYPYTGTYATRRTFSNHDFFSSIWFTDPFKLLTSE